MDSQDFSHLPPGILGDVYYDDLITRAIDEALAASDDVTMQKNIVSFRYWEAVVTFIMMEPAKQSTLAASDEYTKDQLDFFRGQYEVYRSLVSRLYPLAGSGGAVLTAMDC